MTLAAPVPLADQHLDSFDSGNETFDAWLRRRARANQISGASRTFVVADDDRVVAYYSLAAGALDVAAAPGAVRRNMPDPIPMAVLGRLAVDSGWQGRWLGAALLRDAVERTAQAASILGIRGLLVHVLSEQAKAFYERHGFTASPAYPMTLILSLKGIVQARENPQRG